MAGHECDAICKYNEQVNIQGRGPAAAINIHYKLFYNTVLHITRFKDGSQKCIDYIEKNDHKWSFFNIIYTFLFGYKTVV